MDTDAGKDFFISYTSADKKWAEWIAWQLEEAQYSTILQAWDFQPGMNFVLEMDKAARAAHCTIVVLTPGYLSAQYTPPEWAVAFRRDPKSEQGALLPVRIQKCEVEGLLGPIVYIDLVGLDEARARETLLVGIRRERGKPETAPGFPGAGRHTIPEPQRFPGGLPLIWNIPYPRNQYFTGRDDILKNLSDALRTGKTAALTQPQAISGLGGIGKTQSAVEYAFRYSNDYQAVLWARAETRQFLISDFIGVAGLLNLPEKDAQDQNKAVEAVKRWLKEHRDWLLILDNADDLAMVREFIPPVFGGHLLLTTRAQAMGRLAHHIEMEKMGSKEGALFLLRRAGIIAEHDVLEKASEAVCNKAKEISQEMDGLPLALDQAGAYIEETSCGLADYLDLYQKHGAALRKRRGGLVADHPKPVATTWSLSFEQIERSIPAAVELLRLCAFLHPDAIPEEIFIEGVNELNPTLQAVVFDPLKLNDVKEELLRYSLIHRHSAERTLSLHRLVQAVLKDEMREDMQRSWAESVVRLVESTFPSTEGTMFGEVINWPRNERYLPHVRLCATYIERWGMATPAAAALLTRAGHYLHERGQYKEAEAFLQQALAIREKVLGTEHPETATTLNILGMLFISLRRYKQAMKLFRRTLAIWEKTLGPEHPNTAKCLHNLGSITMNINPDNYEQAVALLQRAVAIRERALGPEHPFTLNSLNNLGSIHASQGKFEDAEPLLRRVLAIREQKLGVEHPSTALSYESLAQFYEGQGKFNKAESLYKKAVAAFEKTVGTEHPDTADSLNNLAEFYAIQGNFTESEEYYRRVLTIQEGIHGSEHLNVANILTALARLYHSQKMFGEAQTFYLRAIAIYEKILGPKHPTTATIRENYNGLVRGMKQKGKGQHQSPQP